MTTGRERQRSHEFSSVLGAIVGFLAEESNSNATKKKTNTNQTVHFGLYINTHSSYFYGV